MPIKAHFLKDKQKVVWDLECSGFIVVGLRGCSDSSPQPLAFHLGLIMSLQADKSNCTEATQFLLLISPPK